MITSIRLENFKNFADETLRLGPFTVIVGANASGKSNIRDAFRFLHGIGRGYSLADIVGGKHGAGGQAEWEPMRGAAREMARFGHEAFSITTKLKELNATRAPFRHEIGIGIGDGDRSGFRVIKEELAEEGREAIYASRPLSGDSVREQGSDDHLLLRIAREGQRKNHGHAVKGRSDQPFLTQIQDAKQVARKRKDEAREVADAFADMRFLDLTPDRMRRPSFPGQVVLGDGGENLPTALHGICADDGRGEILAEWVSELTSVDVEDFRFPVDPVTGRIGLAIRETNGRVVSAHGASDGALRFLAMLAALLGPDPARLYFFEEIEKSIHPSRIHLLLELIETQTKRRKIQVVATTHSPTLLTMMNDQTFGDASVVCRLPGATDAVIRPVRALPNAGKLGKKYGLGRLLEEGWMETALAFTEDGGDGEGRAERAFSSSRNASATTNAS